jgi:hypothetical protein
MFAGVSATEGVAVKAMPRLRLEPYVALKVVFLNNPVLHDVPRFRVIIVNTRKHVIPQIGYFSYQGDLLREDTDLAGWRMVHDPLGRKRIFDEQGISWRLGESRKDANDKFRLAVRIRLHEDAFEVGPGRVWTNK